MAAVRPLPQPDQQRTGIGPLSFRRLERLAGSRLRDPALCGRLDPGSLVIEPNAQVIYSRYDAKDATLQGTRMRSDADNAWQSRVGVRVYPRTAPQADKPAVRPFLETNWLHNGGNPKVRMGENTLAAQPARNALELKLGAEGRVGKRVQVSGHVFGQAGEHDQRGYGGMLNVSYRW
ncbi:hypothetical protein DDE05_55650 [Streptomyces cavourensis]|nr:hypothetical protein DDE05_55650 [Streptomyces cavourensis]